MAYKRPLVIASGQIEELQAGDSLDASVVNLQFSGLTASQVLFAASGMTATGQANFTFTTTTSTLNTPKLSLNYPPTTGSGTALNLANVSIPRGQQVQQLAFNDMYDAFAYADLTFGASPSPAASSGTWGNIFRASNVGGNGPSWTNPSTITLTFPTAGVQAGNYNLCMVMPNAASLTPTNIQIATTAGTVFSGAPTFLANPNANGSTWISPTFGAPFSTLGTVTVTLTFSGTGSFQLCRLALYSTSTPMDNFALSRDGGTVYGNVVVTGTMTQGGNPLNGVINTSISLYIDTTGSDSSGDGSSGNPWATIAQAMLYLQNFSITPSAYVTIHVAAGNYTGLASINLLHPNGSQISIVGATPGSTTVSSVTAFGAPSSGVSSVTLVVASAGTIAVNDYLLIVPAATIGTLTGTCAHWWNIFGCHKVTGVSGTSITINVATYTVNSGAPSQGTLTGLTAISAVNLKTRLTFTGSGVALVTAEQNYAIGEIGNLVMVGAGAGIGINAGYIYLATVGVVNFAIGFNGNNLGLLNAYTSAFSGNATGLQLTFVSTAATNQCVINGGITGVYNSYNTTLYETSSAVVGCSTTGHTIVNNSSLIAVAPICCENNAYGFECYNISVVVFGQAGGYNGICSYNVLGSVYTLNVAMTTGGSTLTFTGNGHGNAESPAQGVTAGNYESYNFA
jgi:hypothetical protein